VTPVPVLDGHCISAASFRWIHLDAPTPEQLRTVLAPFAFHPLVIED